jgi:hypothetical protein
MDRERNFLEMKKVDEKPIFSRDNKFVSEALALLKSRGSEPEWGKVFFLPHGTELHKIFFSFLIQELENLPFNNEVGESIPIRDDAKEAVRILTGYLKKRLGDLENGKKWSTNFPKEVKEIFRGGLEVFKNQIYPEHGISGIGYNLDLASNGSGRKAEPSKIVLERYYVEAGKKFDVTSNGVIGMFLSNGEMRLDLDDEHRRNIHYE